MSLPEYNPWPHLTLASQALEGCRMQLSEIRGIAARALRVRPENVRNVLSALTANLSGARGEVQSAVDVSREWEIRGGTDYPRWAVQARRIADVLDDAVWAADGQLRLLETGSLSDFPNFAFAEFARIHLDVVLSCAARLAGVALDVRPAPGEEVPRG